MSETAYVRTDMIAQQPPPAGQRGPILWMRKNLFSGWFNTVLTLAGVFAVLGIIYWALPWFLHGVWNAKSLGECRQIVAATWGENASGACWAVIRERWNQFLFGFYPSDQYWRPTLTFCLMIAAVLPVLFFDNRKVSQWVIGTMACVGALVLYGLSTPAGIAVLIIAIFYAIFVLAAVAPRRLLWVTALFPAAGFWLLWGGSLWAPVSVLVGLGLVLFTLSSVSARSGLLWAGVVAFALFVCLFLNPFRLAESLTSMLAYLLTFGQWRVSPSFSIWIGGTDITGWLPLHGLLSSVLQSFAPLSLPHVDSDRFGGFLLAEVIGVTAIVVALPLGIILALGRKSDMPLVKMLCVGFIEFVRGVPLITMLFTASLLLQYFLPPQTQFDLILRVIILVTLFSAAYIAEVVRGGLAALPRGQYEAADALGLDYWQAQRFIVMPQALKISIPGIVSSFIGLFKDTTLVAFVGLMDPLKGVTQIVRADINWKGIYWEPYIFVGAIFFIFCFGMSRYSMYLERRLKRDHR